MKDYKKIIDILKRVVRDIPALKYKQFTIDWIDNFEDKFEHGNTDEEIILAIQYEVENILEIMEQKAKDIQVFQAIDDLIILYS